jgi:hypothetical protein
MADCTGKITANLLLDCDNLPVGGLTVNAVIINIEDIDRSATTIDATNRVLMTNLQLLSGKTGYSFQGIKQSNGKNYSLVQKENLPNKWNHGFTGVVFNPTPENKLQVSDMSLGGKYVVVVEQLWKGEDSEDAFEVLGFYTGVELIEATNNSAENDNTINLVFANADGFEEPGVPHTLLDTDYATTKAAFNNLFIEA